MIGRGHAAGFAEFVALMATLMSLVALSIDAMLPALGEIGEDLGVEHANSVQLVASVMYLGMAADSYSTGRCRTAWAGGPGRVAFATTHWSLSRSRTLLSWKFPTTL